MIFNPRQLQEITDIFGLYQLAFIAQHVGADILTQTEKNALIRKGFDPKMFENIGTVEEAFKFGMMSSALDTKQMMDLGYDKYKRFLQSGNVLPLNSRERSQLEALKYQAYSDIKGLGNKMSQDFNQVYVEKDQEQRAKYEKLVEKTAKKTIENRKSINSMISELGNKTQDWTRDFGRISDYVLHSSFDHGRSSEIMKEHGSDAKVYKDVYPGACKSCIQKYLTAGIGSKPKIFNLSTLVANGSNVGRKRDDWLPVIGPLHPWCRCTLEHVPRGYEWDDETKSFSKPKRDFERRVRRRSKIQVQVGDKLTEV